MRLISFRNSPTPLFEGILVSHCSQSAKLRLCSNMVLKVKYQDRKKISKDCEYKKLQTLDLTKCTHCVGNVENSLELPAQAF